MKNVFISFLVMRNSIFVLSFLICRITFWKNVCSDLFGGLFLYQACWHLVKVFKDFNAFSLLHFQRLQCLQSCTSLKTSMSSVFYISKDFNVFSLLHFKRLQCLQSFTSLKTSMSSVFYISKDFNVFSLLYFQRFQCLQSFTFSKTSMSPILFYDTTTSFA